PNGPRGIAVKFSEYAAALDGTPHGLATTLKSRPMLPANAGPPNAPVGLRVSAMRHGPTGTKRRPGPAGLVCVSAGNSVTDSDALLDGSATLATVMLTVSRNGITGGAVYRPELLSVPTFGLAVHATAELGAFRTVAV